jgi:hypothetical protein
MTTLQLDALRVESFYPADRFTLAADEDTSAGTNYCWSFCAPTCGEYTCANTCPPTCWASCHNSLCITDCQGGGGTGTAVETCNRCIETEGQPWEPWE